MITERTPVGMKHWKFHDVPSTIGAASDEAATAAYATMTRRFLRGYDRTSYKDEVKTSVATRWPLLWAASPKFREEFRRATRDDDARGEADAESESEAAQEDVPSVPRDIDR